MPGDGFQSLTKIRVSLRPEAQSTARRSPDISPSQSFVNSSSTQSRIHTPSSSVPSTPLRPPRPSSPEKQPLCSTNAKSFLTAVAAQERRVLELKEELHKAESDLSNLKKQWAAHESVKKRDELRDLEQLRPLKQSQNGQLANSTDEITRRLQHLERRRADPSWVRNDQRKVFSGSRHARTLSLLSARDSDNRPSLVTNVQSSGATNSGAKRLSAAPQMDSERERYGSTNRGQHLMFNPPDKDAILETGKQLVGDVKSGLWAFFEDIRQVTVGQDLSGEAVRAPPQATIPGHRKSQCDLQGVGSKNARNIGAAAAVRPVLSPTPKIDSIVGKAGPDNADSSEPDDGWDDWGSPDTKRGKVQCKNDESASEPLASPLTERSTPRTSTSSADATPRPKRMPVPSSKAG